MAFTVLIQWRMAFQENRSKLFSWSINIAQKPASLISHTLWADINMRFATFILIYALGH